jgi:hypothetical protein
MGVFRRGAELFLMIAIGAAGCDSASSTSGGASMDELASAASAQRAAEQQKEDEKSEAERKAQEAQQAAQAAAGTPLNRAGRPQVGEGGYLTAIVGARRRIMNEADRWPWVQAVQHFKAEHGRLPKDHAEFMREIVERHEINLGYKEEGQEFFYDPNEGDWGEVYVVEYVEEPAEEVQK